MKKYIKDNKLLILFILVLISFCLFSMIFVTYENDYFWHIKAGEYMVKHHTILTDFISYLVIYIYIFILLFVFLFY